MPTRTAHTTWQGSLETGAGQVELTSSRLATFDVSFPKRAADEAKGSTSPEELLAAAHTSCYAMQLSAELGGLGGAIESLDVAADVTLGPDPAGGFRLTKIHLTVRGRVAGVDSTAFVAAAAAAKANCPVSKALTGVSITFDAALEE